MALSTKISIAAQNAACDAITNLVSNGWIDVYTGSQPTNPDTAIGAQVLCFSLRLATPAFGAAAAGVATAGAITSDAAADSNGTIAWCRVLAADHTTAVIDGSVGTGTHNLVVSTTSVTIAVDSMGCSALTLTVPVAGA